MPRNKSERSKDLAREARRQPSVAEEILWARLRNSKLGFKFRREHPIERFRLDFYCAEAKVAVEMDGEQHDPIRDTRRDELLAQLGVLTIRICNREFFGLDEAPFRDDLANIQQICSNRANRPPFAPYSEKGWE